MEKIIQTYCPKNLPPHAIKAVGEWGSTVLCIWSADAVFKSPSQWYALWNGRLLWLDFIYIYYKMMKSPLQVLKKTQSHLWGFFTELLLQCKSREMFQSSLESLAKMISSQIEAHKTSAEIWKAPQILLYKESLGEGGYLTIIINI